MGITLERAASEIAEEAHEGQMYGDRPYITHPEAVVGVLLRFGVMHQATVAAAWLHDVIEDTNHTEDTIKARLADQEPVEVARMLAMVDAVTDGSKGNRKARKARSYALIPQVAGSVVLKLADRIANVEASQDNNPRKLQMYREEQEAFKAVLRSVDPSQVEQDMWFYLEGLLAA